MGKTTGFMEHGRELPRRRPVPARLRDWKEGYESFPEESTKVQGARCMDCGIPFCHEGCPLGNLIPEWNDLVYRDDWTEAIERLHATNNFPEFTGRLCPAPCEGACVLGINDQPVTIERIEYEIVERAWSEGGGHAAPGGPPRPGGLLRYGIPEFKMEKAVLDRRLAQLEGEGVEFRCGVSVGQRDPEVAGAVAPGVTVVHARALVHEYDAGVLAGGATLPRDLPVPGRDLDGVHLAMDYLKPSNMVREGLLPAAPVSAEGRRGVIIGGGDTGADR